MEHVASRPAVVGDELTLTRSYGGSSSKGFFPTSEENSTTAVCLIPGTELAFAEPIKINACDSFYYESDHVVSEYSVAKFVEKGSKENDKFQYHDALELPNGRQVILQALPMGQKCTVLQLPAQPEVMHIDLADLETSVQEVVAEINNPEYSF